VPRKRKHKDVEYVVGNSPTDDFDEAAALAVVRSLSNGEPATIDVLVFSRAGAKFYGGDDAIAQYREDPDASVFERIVVQAQSLGRVPQ